MKTPLRKTRINVFLTLFKSAKHCKKPAGFPLKGLAFQHGFASSREGFTPCSFLPAGEARNGEKPDLKQKPSYSRRNDPQKN